jgi:hypothetical protein
LFPCLSTTQELAKKNGKLCGKNYGVTVKNLVTSGKSDGIETFDLLLTEAFRIHLQKFSLRLKVIS